MVIKARITTGVPIKGGANISVMSPEDGISLTLVMMENTRGSDNSFDIFFFANEEETEMFSVQRYYPYGVYIFYTFKKERPYSDGLRRNYIIDKERLNIKNPLLNPTTENEMVYEYIYMPHDRAEEIIKDLYLNGWDALANYTWENEDKGPASPPL